MNEYGATYKVPDYVGEVQLRRDRLPVVVRKWRDTNKLIALFVTTVHSHDTQLCWSYAEDGGLQAANPTTVVRRTVEVERSVAEQFLTKCNSGQYKRAIGEEPTAQFEIHQRDRIVQNLMTRKEKWNAQNGR